jgi:hypothetical protein
MASLMGADDGLLVSCMSWLSVSNVIQSVRALLMSRVTAGERSLRAERAAGGVRGAGCGDGILVWEVPGADCRAIKLPAPGMAGRD